MPARPFTHSQFQVEEIVEYVEVEEGEEEGEEVVEEVVNLMD